MDEIITLINNKIRRGDIYHKVVEKGYKGSRTRFFEYCKQLSDFEITGNPGKLRIDEIYDEKTMQKYHYVSRKQLFSHIWNGDDDISNDDLEFIKASYPIVTVLCQCLSQFKAIFETKSKEKLMEYITTYKISELAPIRKNAEGLEKDIIPVTNAVIEEYSNGFVEGVNNKLKLVKRIAYGRCKLPLLKSKIILPGFFVPEYPIMRKSLQNSPETRTINIMNSGKKFKHCIYKIPEKKRSVISTFH